jgi:restriction endonuclease S subunit
MFLKQSYPIISSSSLIEISNSHSLRCDGKQSESRFLELYKTIKSTEYVYLGNFLPEPLIKGGQHSYLQEGEGVPVVNTLSIQNMRINIESCRHISEDDYQSLNENKILKKNDVLLTMDGGSSIGKPVLFELDGEFTVDSHVAILRPSGISPKALAYLLASPIGQLQFQKFESGASGQTAVTEEDLRRFLIPTKSLKNIESYVNILDLEKTRIESERLKLEQEDIVMWQSFMQKIIS